MLKHYLTITLRSLGKQRGYAFINVFGLAVGIAFCALIFLYVRDELTFDRFHERADRIYRVIQQEHRPDGSVENEWTWQPMPLAPALKDDLPEVEQAVRLFEQEPLIRYGDQTFEESVLFADPSLFEVFSFPLRQGTPATALADLNSIVLSTSAARKLFGGTDPMGQTLQVRLGDTFYDVVVTGIAADVPGNASVRFDYLLPFAKLSEAYEWIRNRETRWNASSFNTYALLREGASRDALEAKLPAFRATHYPDEEVPHNTYRLQPLTEIHLDPGVRGGLTPASDPTYSYILAAIALAILLIACINFTTLAIGRSASRAREVGIRKAVGAQRRQLMLQFWGEALLLSGLALAAGIALAELFLPTFNALAVKTLHFDYLGNATTVGVLVGLMLLVGLIAGGYPALVLSGFRPIETLRQRLRLGGANPLTRSLVVVQFALSVFLIVGTLVMLRQLHHIQTKNLGFDEENVVVIPTQQMPGPLLLERFQDVLAARPDVLGITGTSSSFTRGYSLEGWDYKEEEKRAYVYRVEANYVNVMGMELVAGRTFDPQRATDSTGAVLVNEAFVRDFGWADPIGQTIDGFYAEPVVVGVVKDINFLSLHQAVEPMVLTLDPGWGVRHLLVRIAPGDAPATLDALRATWQDVAPGVPFQYSFLDDDLNQQYESEQRWSRIVGYGAVFAVLIACLGLFGLAALSVAGRTKEIGIRKVLGASVTRVTLLLSKDFVKLVLVAVVLAAPVAYVALQRWLDGFAYRIEMSGWTFLIAGLTALVIALATVGYQAVRAALTDPVESLRYE